MKKSVINTVSQQKVASPQSFASLALSCVLLMSSGWILSPPALAEVQGLQSQRELNEHTGQLVDTSAEITALAKMDSIKNSQPLSLTVPTIEHFQTDNGVPVAFVRTTNLPIVDVALLFNAGTARDGEVRPQGFGIANMTASMLFQGTKSLSEEAFLKQVEGLGIQLNSSVSKDAFVVSLRSLSDKKYLDPALALLEQSLKSPAFSAEILQRNKARLMIGLQQQQEDPASIAGIAFNEALYQNHPYAHPATGTLATVPTISVKDLQKFHQQFLVAKNATLAITGDLSLSEAKQLANSLTSVLPQGQPAKALPTPKPAKPQKIHIPFDSTQTTVVMGHLGKAISQDSKQLQQAMNFSVANDVLAGGSFNARLMKEIRKKRGYTYGIYGSMQPMQTKGVYAISFSTRNEKAKDAIKATIDTVNASLKQGISEAEMDLTKENLKNGFPMSFASNAGINSLLGNMQFYHLPDSYLSGYLQRIDNVTLADANAALNQYIDPKQFIIVTVGQGDENSSTK